ncbi:hypothetical protein [Burkholderia oklahomensis]|uniref:hypothetical protein n=1 Tax=Burkholderia oklahomensis TaxID=342113 RepID=UPI0002DFE9C5|nr:hypothetical protein [Burkholderia oklahomensis]QPS37174.1 hypothetical protein I6G57_18260 [Burkholderia oklahomensis]
MSPRLPACPADRAAGIRTRGGTNARGGAASRGVLAAGFATWRARIDGARDAAQWAMRRIHKILVRKFIFTLKNFSVKLHRPAMSAKNIAERRFGRANAGRQASGI